MKSYSFNHAGASAKAMGSVFLVGLGVTLYSLWRGRQVANVGPVTPRLKLGIEGDQSSPESLAGRVQLGPKKQASVASSSTPVELMHDPQFGKVLVQPFSSTWLADYPQIVEHLESEHLLHVKGVDEDGRGLTWHTEKFKTDMDVRFNPEAKVDGALRGGFQMKLGYFIVPESHMKSLQASSLNLNVLKDLQVFSPQGDLIGYRFFVHPQGYDHFRGLHKDSSLHYVPPGESEFVCTPTSSYRSLAIRKVETDDEGICRPAAKSVPFIVKLGVGGDILGSDRWLSEREILRSVQCQRAFDGMSAKELHSSGSAHSSGEDLVIFPESMGMYLDGIDSYKPEKTSGILIREFPADFLAGESRIVSMAALMSVERVKKENGGICAADQREMKEFRNLPLIYEVMEASLRKGLAKSPMDFLMKYFVYGYVNAIKSVTFQEGMTLEPHSQNLCMVLNPDLTPRGFAYRDHGGIWVDTATRGLQDKDMTPFYDHYGNGNALFKTKGALAKGYIGSFSWFYRYQVFIKILNVVTQLQMGEEMMDPPIGAPYQIGAKETLPERNLQSYVIRQLDKTESCVAALSQLKELSLTFSQYQQALETLDGYYYDVMNKYFLMDSVGIPKTAGGFPSAEGGSGYDQVMTNHRGFLGKYRFYKIDSASTRFLFSDASESIRSRIMKNLITSFENQDFNECNAQECLILDKGICLLNSANEVVGFTPYETSFEKGWYEKTVKKV